MSKYILMPVMPGDTVWITPNGIAIKAEVIKAVAIAETDPDGKVKTIYEFKAKMPHGGHCYDFIEEDIGKIVFTEFPSADQIRGEGK